jgi:hypothetical protein
MAEELKLTWDDRRLHERALDHVRRAKAGDLTLIAFNEEWPFSEELSPFLTAVREDVEDAVEHFPAGFFSRQPLWHVWYESEMYKRLLLDEALLQMASSDVDLERRRQAVLRSVDLLDIDESGIAELVR